MNDVIFKKHSQDHNHDNRIIFRHIQNEWPENETTGWNEKTDTS